MASRRRTLSAALGVRRAHTARFLTACGYLARYEEYAASPDHVEADHVWTEVADGGTRLAFGCAACGAQESIDLPRPARLMLHPAGVPPGLGDLVWEVKMKFHHDHLACEIRSAGTGPQEPGQRDE